MAYAVLPSMRSRHNAGHDIVWCRSWSAKRNAVRPPTTHDPVAKREGLQLRSVVFAVINTASSTHPS